MPFPASPQFNIFDWNPRALSAVDGSSLAGSAATGMITAGVINGKFFSNAEYLALFADSKVNNNGVAITSFSIPLAPVGNFFTLELELALANDIPDSWTEDNQHIFISLNNNPTPGVGFFATKKGLYLANSLTDKNPTLLSGSDKFFTDAKGNPQSFVIRAIGDNTTGRVAFYMATADAAYDEENGANWWLYPDLSLIHNFQIKPSTGALTAFSILLEAKQGTELSVIMYSARLADTLLTPVFRPVAIIDATWQAVVGKAITLSGKNSYDKYGAAITYDWHIEHAPKGSTAILQGATRASATSVVGPVTDKDFVVFSKNYTSKDNLKTVTVLGTNPPNQSLSLVVLDTGLVIKPDTDALGNIITTALQLSVASKNFLSAAYTDALAENYVIELASPLFAGNGVIVSGTYAFSGGTGSYIDTPVFIPDLPGPYVFSLRVNNGVTYGAKVLFTVSITQTDEMLGEIPDGNYIFKYLPDFWNLVKNKEQLAVIWAAITQVLTGDLVQAWQNDYSKSIRDISRKYQRRWTSFPNKVIPATNYIYGYDPIKVTITDVVASTALDVTGYTTKTATILGPSASPISTGLVLCRANDNYPTVVEINKITAAGANWTVQSTSSDLPVCRKLLGGFALQNVGVNTYTDASYNFSKSAAQSDYVRTVAPSGEKDVKMITALPAATGYVTTAAALTDVFTDKQTTWEIVRKVRNVRLTVMPYFVFEDGTTDYELQIGDMAVVALLSPYSSTELNISCTVLAVSTKAVFVDLTPVIDALNTEAKEDDINPNKIWTDYEIAERAVSIAYFLRTRRSRKVIDLVAVPKLGKSTTSAEYVENRDFTVSDERVHITPLLTGTASMVANFKDITTSSTDGWYSLPALPTLDDLYEAAGETDTSIPFYVLLETGTMAGLYEVSTLNGNHIAVTSNFARIESSTFSINRYRGKNVPPDNHWAEVSFYDNWRAIEGNFGLMVGLPKQYILDDNVQVDYLTLVKSIVFSFMSGPTLGNLALMTEAFINVPFVEHDCQVLHILPPVDNKDGIVVVRDPYGRDVRYRYPSGAVLGINPTTQKTIEAYPTIVDRPDKLNAIDKAVYDNAILPAYTRLFDVVQVDDFISNNALVESFLPGQNVISKFHTFVVRVPLEIAKTTEAFALIRTYLTMAKAAYTRFILVGTLSFLDEIVVEEILTKIVTLLLKDTPHTAPFALNPAETPVKNLLSVVFPAQPTSPANPSIPKYFADGTVYTTNVDSIERYESGYQEGVLDDYSGDGSINAVHAEIDRVNSIDFDDFDILNSYLWVPITKDNTAPYNDVEFKLGEPIRILDNGAVLADTPNRYQWNASPPVIVHIGAGVHPKIPGVYSYQVNHPHTYLLLGFKRTQSTASLGDPTAVISNYANAQMIDGLYYASLALTGPLNNMRIEGRVSGARASLAIPVPNRVLNPADRKYFLLERINQVDKLDMYNLNDEPVLINTVYINNMSAPTTIQDVANAFTGNALAGPPAFAPYTAHVTRMRQQLQQFPYDPALADNLQFVPATAAGLYYSWAGTLPAIDNFSLDYVEPAGPVSTTPTAITAFTRPVGWAGVKNVHLGFKFTRAGGWHKTHGFVTVTIPKPDVRGARWNNATTTMRVEGMYFISPDTVTPATIHTAVAYNGNYTGSWVFVRNNLGVETAATTVTFETGLAAGPGLRFVLGIDGSVQTSTGHVLNATFPGLVAGVYTVIVRHYRPFVFRSGAASQLEIDADEIGGVTV
jgi:hypothetical protein